MANTNANTLFIYKNQIGGGIKPTITGFTPTSGEALSTFVTVTGAGFTSVSGVTLGTLQLPSYTVINANTLVFRVPNMTGTGIIGIANQFGTLGYSAQSFTVTGLAQVPTIFALTPQAASVGQTINISGTGFNTIAANNTVFFGRMKATVTGASATLLNVIVPTGAANDFIRVTNTINQLTGESQKQFVVTFNGPNTIIAASFASRVNVVADNNSYHTVFADLDGDGRNDMLVTGGNNNRFSYHRNTGTGTNFNFFANRQLIGVSFPYKLCVADFDADGRLDVAISSHNTNFIEVFKNISSPGAIAFAPSVQFATGTNPAGIEAADIDRDGAMDIIVSNYGTNSISVFRNSQIVNTITSSSFNSKLDFTTQLSNYNISVGDIDGDGWEDVVAATLNTNQISVLRNISSIGNVQFATKVDVTTQNTPYDIKLYDIDNDGKLDIISSHSGDQLISVLRNISVTNTITAASFAPRVNYSTGSSAFGLALTDIDGDGRTDVAVSNQNSPYNLSFFKNNTTGAGINAATFAPRLDIPLTNNRGYYLGFGDIDGDGKDDLGTNILNNAQVGLFRNQSAAAPSISGFNPTSGQAGVSVFTLTGSELLGVNRLSIGGGFVQNFISKTDNQLVVRVPAAAQTGNIVLQNIFGATTTSVGVFTITAPYPYPSISGITPIYNGVGNQVNISGNNFSSVAGNNIVYFGAARATVTGFSTNLVTALMPSGATYNALTLLNKDNGISLTGANYLQTPYLTFTGANTINGNTFGARIDIVTPNTGTAGAAADFDNDGKNDIVVGYNSQITIYRNNSTAGTLAGTSFTPSNFAISGNPFDLKVVDIDNDGRLDIVIGNQNSNSFGVLRNISTGVGNIAFAPVVTFQTLPSSTNRGISAVDVDLDGYIDVVVTEVISGANVISVYRNTGTSGTINGANFSERYTVANLASFSPIDVEW